MITTKKRTVNESACRKILTGMIVSTPFMNEVGSFYNPDLIDVRFVRTIAEWCMDYYKRYGVAPGAHIKDIFSTYEESMEPTERDLVAGLLLDLSYTYENAKPENDQYLLDLAEKFFKEKSLTNLFREANGLIVQGNPEEAEQLLGSYKRVGRPQSTGENPFLSAEATERAFARNAKSLFTFPGKLGLMLNDELKRERFIGVLGADKSGKSFWLNEIALQASKARCNVALFQVGDMTEDQVRVRLGVRLCSRNEREKYCGAHLSPTLDCKLNQTGKCAKGKACRALPTGGDDPAKVKNLFLQERRHKPCCDCAKEPWFVPSLWYEAIPKVNPITWRDAWRAGNKLLCRIKGRGFRLSCYASETLNVAKIKASLDEWETQEDFIPDVIVIDYADNLCADNKKEDHRDQINTTWKLLRGLSQDRHCLLVTATQADAESYDKPLLSRKNFSENKLKNAHVTAMIGLNQSTEEKQSGLMRLNTLVQREGEFFSNKVTHIAMDLWRGRPLLFSF